MQNQAYNLKTKKNQNIQDDDRDERICIHKLEKCRL